MKASDLRRGGNTSFLFKGPFGFGKTLAAASFALTGPVYLSYWDKKSPIELATFFTKKRFGDDAEKILDNITYDVYSSENANEYLNKLIDMVSDCRYIAVINDSLTYMTSAVVGWSMNFGKDRKLHKKIKDLIPDWDEYKVETSLVTQCIDVSRKLPCHIIWTAHPLPSTKIEGSGSTIRVSKVNNLVSYGTKVAGMVPGGFTEIYHFSQQSNWDAATGKSSKKYIVSTEAVGDDFAKSPLLGDYVKEFDITDKLFYKVWKGLIDEASGIVPSIDDVKTIESAVSNPFQQPVNKWKV